MKIIEVSCCGECIHLTVQVSVDDSYFFCAKQKYKQITDTSTIDKDCPLQDISEISYLSETLRAVLFNKNKEVK